MDWTHAMMCPLWSENNFMEFWGLNSGHQNYIVRQQVHLFDEPSHWPLDIVNNHFNGILPINYGNTFLAA